MFRLFREEKSEIAKWGGEREERRGVFSPVSNGFSWVESEGADRDSPLA